MTNEQRHIIKRQILEVEVGSSGINGQVVQHRLSEAYRVRVIPALEKTLNRLSDHGRRISIDRLEIDLGELSLDDLDGKFSHKVEEQLFRLIHEKMHTHHLQKELAAQGISTGTEDDGKLDIKTSSAAKADLLAGYLKTGRIPWNGGMQAFSKPVSDLLEELLDEAPAEATDLLKRELRYSLQRTRLILQMPDKLIRKAVDDCAAPGKAGTGKRTPAGFAAGMIEALNRRELPVRWNVSALRTRIWNLVIDRTVLQGSGSTYASTEKMIHDLLDGLIFGRDDGAAPLPQPQRFLKMLVDELPSTAHVRESGFGGRLPVLIRRYAESTRQQWRRHQDGGTGVDAGASAESKLDKKKAETAQTADKKSKSDQDRDGSAEESDSPDIRMKHDGSIERAGDEPGEKESSGKDSRHEPETEQKRPGAWDNEKQKQEEWERMQAGDEIIKTDAPSAEIHRSFNIREKADEAWVQNAGLVLLHPFLVRFFDQAGLVKEKQFFGQDAHLRAVHLLQYIVTGEQETPEQELFLNKLLCGLEPEYPVPAGIELTRQEKEESENVLNSVVGHWKALKKSSPEAVRSTFLRREGLVSREGMHGGWKVTIERNSFDVLLNRLPWGVSMIKMPWNSYLINVEW